MTTPVGAQEQVERVSEGLKRRQFVLHYQPQFHVSSGEPVALEALVRWNAGGRGLLLPSHFMQEVVECGLSMRLLELILDLACVQGKAWREAGFRPIKIAVNLSVDQLLHADLCRIIDSVLDAARPDIPWLELELPVEAAFDDATRRG
jgi:EAL domain-containing protein (putative c-di-GMP-specific phosphodiesterase class I)